jgi:hypothetical protein
VSNDDDASPEAVPLIVREEFEMALRSAPITRRGVIGAPVAPTAAVVGTAAVVSHGVNRGQDRRDDRRDRR